MNEVTKLPKRIRVHELRQRGDGQLGTPWIAKVDHDVDDCFDAGFFAPAVGNLLAGDTIRVVRLEKNRLAAFVDTVVIERRLTPAYVEIARVGPTMDFTAKTEIAEATPSGDPEIYVPEDCTAEWAGPSMRWRIKGASGTVYATHIDDKDEALSMARGDKPLPAKAAA